MTDMPKKIAAWRFTPSKADEWVHGGWSEDHDHKTTTYIREDEDEANRAAATDLLEALEGALDTMGFLLNESITLGNISQEDEELAKQRRDQARAAIAKAKGETK